MSKVLIVDDIEENLYFLRTLLTANGYQVEAAHNGKEALSLAQTSPPDLIISDLLMPVMDGFTLCHAWHRDQRLARIPFVVYTATYTNAGDEDLALQAGADLFLLRPQEPEDLMQAIRGVLQKHQAADVPPRLPAEPPEIFLQNYNAALIRKLEDKLVELNFSNRRLVQETLRQKQALDNLRQSEERFSKIFRSNPIPMAIAKLGAGVVAMNDAALQKLGLTVEEVIGRTPEEIGVSVEPAARLREELRRANHRMHGRETQFRSRSGRVLTFSLFTERIEVAGEPHVVIMALDITEQKQQEDLKRMLGSAVTAASDAIIITDTDFHPAPTVLYANPAFTRLTGYTAEEVIGRRTSDTFDARTAAKSMAEIQQVLSDGKTFRGEIASYTKDGRLLQLELDVVPVFDGAGRITHFVAVRRDISRRKIEELNRQRLLRVVFDAQTEERRRISRELHDHTGQLLASMLLRLNVLQQTTSDQAVKRAVREITSVASSTLEDISRLARGLHPAVLEDLGLAQALQRAVEEFSVGGISATFEMAGNAERLPQHVEHEIYQIVKEALTNVQRHSQAGRVSVRLEIGGTSATAAVTDNGVGFDTREPMARGRHLGIVGMSERATLLGGSLRITSTPGEGTTITLTIPVLEPLETVSHERS